MYSGISSSLQPLSALYELASVKGRVEGYTIVSSNESIFHPAGFQSHVYLQHEMS